MSNCFEVTSKFGNICSFKSDSVNKGDKVYTTPQTKPLSDNEIHDIWKSLWEGGNIGHIAYNYARAIEERHGIK